MLCGDDAPDFRLLANKDHTARKWYDCQACPHSGPLESRLIPPGQRYRKVVGLEDGKLFVFRECRGPCPHAEPCPSCNGSGEGEQAGVYCIPCDGTGKIRRAISAPEPGEV